VIDEDKSLNACSVVYSNLFALTDKTFQAEYLNVGILLTDIKYMLDNQ